MNLLRVVFIQTKALLNSEWIMFIVFYVPNGILKIQVCHLTDFEGRNMSIIWGLMVCCNRIMEVSEKIQVFWIFLFSEVLGGFV